VRRKRIEDLGCEPAGAAHALECLQAVQLDDAVAGFKPIVRCDGDVLSHLA